ncbi:MAG: PAS domain S-box protein [Myxococcales bacterium]|nr:PAS domain S-box protein [Myxococcales bacterium]
MQPEGNDGPRGAPIDRLLARVETLERRNAELEEALRVERGLRAEMAATQDGATGAPRTEGLQHSEDRYRELVELAPVGILIHVDHRVAFINAEGARILGATAPQQLVGRAMFDIIDPRDHQMAAARMKQVVSGRTRTTIAPSTWRRLDGCPVHCEVAGSPVVYEGRPASQVVFVDMSERRQAQEELAKLRAAVESSGEIVFLTDRDGLITYVNPEFTRVYGWSSGETVGRVTPRILKSGQAPDEYYAGLWRRLLDKEFLRAEYPNRTKDGRLVWVDGSAGPIVDGGGEIVGFLAVQRDVTESRKRDQLLELTQHCVEHAGDMVLWLDPTGLILYANEKAVEVGGYSRDELIGMHASVLDPNFPEASWADAWTHLKTHRTMRLESSYRTKDGRDVPVEITANYVAFGGHEYNFASARDISERRALSAQLEHAQKMEAVGRLAGGVAHDFNNVLAAILNFSEFLSEGLPQADPLRADLEQIQAAARRGATIARQLLVFSRKDMVRPEIVDLNAAVSELEELLRRLLGEDVKLVTLPAPGLWPVELGPGQMGQILANLAVNARDAMPHGGQFVIATENHVVPEGAPRTPLGAAPGRYVRVQVQDSGCGMTPDVAAHAFEPFFTTKAAGLGTGLGLSIVYGIVKQLGGEVTLHSVPGVGTTIEMLVPAATREVTQALLASPPSPPTGTGQTILVVEDDEAVRAIAARILLRAGYRVEQAANAGEAILICERNAIDLLLSDVVMPTMSGRDLAARLQRDRPGLPALFMSGYAGDAPAGVPKDQVELLQKPFSREQLLASVAAALQRGVV